MSFLKHLVKASTEISIRDMILLRVGSHESARSNNPLHASDLTRETEFCPREVALMELLKIKRKDEFIGATLQMTFDEGKDKQARLNNDYLRDVMVGHWKCVACGHLVVFQKLPKGSCVICGATKKWVYKEVMFTHATAGFTGSVDSLLYVGQPKYRMVEIKIMGQDQWVDLKAPLAEHKLRTNLYLRLIEEAKEDGWAKQINTEVSHVLYWLRGFGKKNEDGKISPFKEFLIRRDDKATDYLVERAQAVRDYRVEKENNMVVSLPKAICSTAMCGRAEKCPVAK